ncbi:HNH endonuclease [Paenibacillus albiflavus]|uniref:HNH endonuclease n=1 Tax=Paenibacillus albiflavus TaxID=2545760 RepID=A0A4R4EA95_9BACL|nr:HNH endonuclease [Paenibacillus albiflavus]TCZ76167.1 HNH endonuclease [Paenibacillus albiflavus]
MPSKPKRPCSIPGCRELTTERYCDGHKHLANQRYASKEYQYLYGRRWAKYSKQFIIQHPLCMCDECKQAVIPLPSEVTDHIVPHKGDITLFWDPRNHQALNKQCHDRKTAKEDGGFGR